MEKHTHQRQIKKEKQYLRSNFEKKENSKAL